MLASQRAPAFSGDYRTSRAILHTLPEVPASSTAGSSACEQAILICVLSQLPSAPALPQKLSTCELFGLDFGLSEGGPLLSDAGGVSSKAAAASLFCWVEY